MLIFYAVYKHVNARKQRKKTSIQPYRLNTGFLELMVRIELTTCSLRVNCSAIEPHQHIAFATSFIIHKSMTEVNT